MATPPAFELVVREGPHPGQRFPISPGRTLIGSGEGCAVRFAANLVRERHAELRLTADGRLEVVDLTQNALVWVNGTPVTKKELGDDTELRVGRVTLMVTRGDWNSSTISSPGAHAVTLSPEDEPEAYVHEATQISGRFGQGELIDGRYRVLARLAQGGMGEVFKVEHVELGKTLALKVMLPDLSDNPEFVNRFKLEAVAASRIGHPNIIDITDFGKTALGRFYFVMEFLDGKTLADILEQEGPLAPARVAELCGQVARALGAAHEQNIVHRDLKPENVIVLQRPGEPERVKVLDFGVARVQVGDKSVGKTMAGIVVGTPQYMSPEQAQGFNVDPRSDVYALGLILQELLTNVPAFHGETPAQVMVKQVAEAPAPLPPSVPEAWRELIGRMLQKNPAHRPQTMKEVVTALEALKLDSAPGRAGPRPSARRPAKAPAAETAVVQRASKAETTTLTQKDDSLSTDTQLAATVAGSSSKTLYAVLGLLVVLLVLGGAVLFTGGDEKPVEPQPPVTQVDPEPTPPPVADPKPEPVAVREVIVRIESVPEGVEVLEKGVLLGNTPLPLKRPVNTILELTLSLAGYQSAERKVMVTDEAKVVSVTLEKSKVPPTTKPPLQKKPNPKLDLKPAPF
jgi:serine/threonine-protein kinase